MWIPEIRPDAGLLLGTALAVAAVSPVQASDQYAYGVCQIAAWDEGAAVRPAVDADSYLFHYHNKDSRYSNFVGFVEKNTKVTLVNAPKHGKLEIENYLQIDTAHLRYHYQPNASYTGRDRFTMLVENGDIKVRIEYLIEAGEELDPLISGQNLCVPEHWKISDTSIPPAADNLAVLLDAASRMATFADLPGSSLGQTTGTTITLDTDAAGHGWYIDYTPYLNEEYLPTNNPNEWWSPSPGLRPQARWTCSPSSSTNTAKRGT